MSDQNSSSSNLPEQSTLQTAYKKNPATVIIAIVLVAMFLFMFVPCIPMPCTYHYCADGTLKRWNKEGEKHTCDYCKNSGIASVKTVWGYVNPR